MSSHTITVPPQAAGMRADIVLAAHLPQSRSQIQKLVAAGKITSSAGQIAKNHRVCAGEVFFCDISPAPLQAAPEDIPLDIVFEDDWLIIVSKPKGMVVHPGAGNHSGTLVNALLAHSSLSDVGGLLRPGIVHRLDRDTSGLMVVAKTNAAHAHLAEQLAQRSVVRVYHAIVVGQPGAQHTTIDAPIARHPRIRTKMCVARTPAAKSAKTDISVIELYPRHSLVEARLHTGRTHQIRVHMAHIGHPLVGDAVYGSSVQKHFKSGQLLHCRHLAFAHPHTHKIIEFDSCHPAYFADAINLLKKGENT